MNKNKLGKKAFIEGMEYLNAYYALLKIDLDNKLVQEVWYENVSHIEDNTFKFVVKDYCKNNIYPPQSPTHLTSKLSELMDLEVENVRNEILRLRERYTKIEFSELANDNVATVLLDEVLKEASPNAVKVINANANNKGYDGFNKIRIKYILFEENDEAIKLLSLEGGKIER